MKLSTRTSIIKNTVVEIISPRLLESPQLENEYLKKGYIGKVTELPEFHVAEEREVQARIEADNIIAEARKKAEEILQSALQENEIIRNDLKEDVRNEILPLAQAEGYAKGLAEAQGEADRIREQSKAYLELAQTALVDEFHKVDRELIGLCLKICEKVLHTALHVNPEKLLNVIRKLTLMPQEKEGIRIHLSSRDWEWYKVLPVEDKPPYPVIIDESLRAGDTFIECSEGEFDARIDSQLEKMGDYLVEEFQYARLDGFSEED